MRVIVVSTPFGASGVFWELWEDPDDQHGEWSRHKIDVYQAAEEGFPVDPEELEQKYPRDIFRQEFCCEFLSDIHQYFGYDLIRRAQYSPCDLDGATTPAGAKYAGIDVASQQDASILADATDDGDTFWIDEAHTLKAAGTSRDYRPQFEDARELLAADSYEAVGVDATGEGAQLGQDLHREFGRPIKLVKGSGWKEARGRIPDLRLAMEDGEFKIPNDPKIRHAFAKIQRTETTDRVKFEAERDAEGHADEFFAALLAWDAAQSKPDRGRSDDSPSVGYQPSPI
jgi:phage FluMu gp28-like protein